MFTSDTDIRLKKGMRYLAASLILAAAAAVYGLFSHGVYSYFMTYAFMIPFLFGALPHLATAFRKALGKSGGKDITENAALCDAQLALIATLTAGSLLKGALDIYGTTNRLLIVYPVLAALVTAAALVTVIKAKKEAR